MPKPSDDFSWFDRDGNDIPSWQQSALNLMAAAEVLDRERDRAWPRGQTDVQLPPECMTLWVAVMLKAMSLECLFKAAWLKRGNRLAHQGRLATKALAMKKPHDLVELATKIGLVVDDSTANTLRTASVIATSIGRYPISMKWQDTSGRFGWSWQDDERIESLYKLTTDFLTAGSTTAAQ